MLRLGKKPARIDSRTLRLKQAMKAVIPPIPTEWDFDQVSPVKVPTPMFLNDELGDCVIAGRGHQTLRFEAIEQKKIISINDLEIKSEYFRETEGADGGLVMLDALKSWRSDGWTIGGNVYTIDAFADVNRNDQQEIMTAIYLFTGIQGGFRLPQSAMDQFQAGRVWEVPKWWDWNGKAILGGHCIYLHGYDTDGLFGTSWGKNFKMTWAWFYRYSDEVYACIDNKDRWLTDSPVDVDALEKYLKNL